MITLRKSKSDYLFFSKTEYLKNIFLWYKILFVCEKNNDERYIILFKIIYSTTECVKKLLFIKNRKEQFTLIQQILLHSLFGFYKRNYIKKSKHYDRPPTHTFCGELGRMMSNSHNSEEKLNANRESQESFSIYLCL